MSTYKFDILRVRSRNFYGFCKYVIYGPRRVPEFSVHFSEFDILQTYIMKYEYYRSIFAGFNTWWSLENNFNALLALTLVTYLLTFKEKRQLMLCKGIWYVSSSDWIYVTCNIGAQTLLILKQVTHKLKLFGVINQERNLNKIQDLLFNKIYDHIVVHDVDLSKESSVDLLLDKLFGKELNLWYGTWMLNFTF